MKILHLYSDWKWTGPAEPAIQMCKALEERGHEVLFACRKTPSNQMHQLETIEMKAGEYGINYTTRFGLNRYFGVRDTLHDLVTLPRFLAKEKIDIVHTHLSHDHGLGIYATRILSRSHRPGLVKSMHKRTVLKDKFWNQRMLNLGKKEGLLVFTESFKKQYCERFGIPREKVGICPMTLDLERFHPQVSYTDQRAHFNIPANAPLIGIVARFQKYRRMDIFMEAAKKVVSLVPETRFLVIGRSSQIQETVITPMKELGLEKNIILPGYLINNYLDTIASLDIFTLMIPGFDGTARAVREAMALGKPCVVSNVGMLPEIVQHDKTGLVFEFTNADSLANSWLELINNKKKRMQMGQVATEIALQQFSIGKAGSSLEAFYQRLLQE
jgi:glycosyltransferase involved in cell wall biosynthesis